MATSHVVDLTALAITAWLLASLVLLAVLVVIHLAEQRRGRSNAADRRDGERF